MPWPKYGEHGGQGGVELANKVLNILENKESNFKVLYPDEYTLKQKIETISKEIYGADGVTYSAAAEKALARIEAMGMGNLPVCMAKNQYSLSDDPKKLGRPTGFTVNIREVYVSAGAGFVVAITGTIMTMPDFRRFLQLKPLMWTTTEILLDYSNIGGKANNDTDN